MRWKLKSQLAVGTQQQAAKRAASNNVDRPEIVTLHVGPPQNYCGKVPSHVPKDAFFHPHLKTTKKHLLSLILTGLPKHCLIFSETWNFTPTNSDPSYTWSQDPLTEAARSSYYTTISWGCSIAYDDAFLQRSWHLLTCKFA